MEAHWYLHVGGSYEFILIRAQTLVAMQYTSWELWNEKYKYIYFFGLQEINIY